MGPDVGDETPPKKSPVGKLPLGAGTSSGVGLGVVAAGVDLATKLVKAVAGARHQRELAEVKRAQRDEIADVLANPPPVHGSAHWATDAEIAANRSLHITRDVFASPSSLLLGALMGDDDTLPRGWLEWDGEGHLVTLAPTRTGKSTMQIIPNLLRYRGSVVVLDPKGELYEKTSRTRREFGEVYRLAPFEATTHAFNPIDTIEKSADALALADLVLPHDPNSQAFFRADGIAFLAGLFEFVKRHSPPERRNMDEVRRISAATREEFLQYVGWMRESPYASVRNVATLVLDKNVEKGIPNLRDTLGTELKVWDDDAIRRASAHSDFSFAALKEKTATVYITVPFTTMKSYAGYLKVVLTAALSAMTDNPAQPEIPVLFILDEFLSLQRFDAFKDAIRTHAGAGVRLWFFLHNVAALEELYPHASGSFWDAAVQVFFGTSNIETAKKLSEMLDYATVPQKTTTYSMGASVSRDAFFDVSRSDSLNVSHAVQLHRRLLMTPGEVMSRLERVLPDDTRFAVAKVGGLPIQLRLVPYFVGTHMPKLIGRLA